jgi:ABC-type polysaccharide/polyol phosphate export permease
VQETTPVSGTAAAADRSDEQELEEAAIGHAIPTVRPLTDADLPSEPPPQQRYRQGLLASIREFWAYREVVYTLAWRDVRVRYKQAALGATWALLNPLVLMVIFSLVFGTIARIEWPGGVPYPIGSYVALVPWALFAGSLAYGATSVISNGSIIRKVYCPREAFPVAATLGAGFDFLASSVVLLGMLIAYGYYPRLTWFAALGLLGVLFILTLALTMLVSILTAFYRDTRYGVPLLIQVLLFATPVAYPIERITEGAFSSILKTLYVYGNPLTPIVNGFRRSIIYGQWPEAGPTGAATGVAVGLLLVTYWFFKRKDALISDVT